MPCKLFSSYIISLGTTHDLCGFCTLFSFHQRPYGPTAHSLITLTAKYSQNSIIFPHCAMGRIRPQNSIMIEKTSRLHPIHKKYAKLRRDKSACKDILTELFQVSLLTGNVRYIVFIEGCNYDCTVETLLTG